MNNILRCGTAKEDITPPVGTQLAGMGKGHTSVGVHDPLYAATAVFSDGRTTAALVTADLLGMDVEILTKVRERMPEEIPPANLFITASHTHYGPNTRFVLPYPERNREYEENLVESVARSIRRALHGLKEVEVGTGRGSIRESVNRRINLPDGTHHSYYSEPHLLEFATGPVDDDVEVMQFREKNGGAVCTLLHYTCHPICQPVDTLSISADYPGPAKKMVEETFGGTALFINGACGNIGPVNGLNGYKRAEEIGTALGEEAIKTVKKLRFGTPGRLDAAVGIVELPVRPEVVAEWKMPIRVQNVTHIKTEIPILVIGNCALAGVPGEAFVELGLELKRKSPFKHTCLMYNTNDDLMYIPTPEAYGQGGYEVSVALVEKEGFEIILNKSLSILSALYDKQA